MRLRTSQRVQPQPHKAATGERLDLADCSHQHRRPLPTLATKADLDAKLATLATTAELQAAIAPLATAIRAEGEQTRRHFDVVADGMRADIRLLAEGLVADRRLTRLEATRLTRE